MQSTGEVATFVCTIHALQSILWEVNDNIDEDLPIYRMPKSLWQELPCPFRELEQLSWCIRACYDTGTYKHEPIHFQATGLHPSEVKGVY